MSGDELAAALARCDRELAEIEEMAASGEHPAWLVHLGRSDWEEERRKLIVGGINGPGAL